MENNINAKQNRKVMIFACILSMISIGLLVFGFFLVSSDKVVLLQSVSNLFNKFDYETETANILIDKISTTNNIGIKSDININYDKQNISLKLDYLENKEIKKSNITLNTNINEEELLNANIILENEKANIFIDKITPNYYNTDFEYISIFKKLKSNDYDKIKDIFKNVITDYIDNEDITKKKTQIIYNNKEKKVNKITYQITNKTIKDITTNFFNTLKEDKVLLEDIAKYLNKTTSELETNMNEVINKLNYKEKKVLYKYSIYYYGFNKIVSYELEKIDSDLLFEYKIQDKEIINIYEKEKNILNIEVTINKNKYDFNGFIIYEDKKIEFKGNIVDNVITINIEDIKCIIKYIEEENNYIYKYNISLYKIEENKDEELINININTQYYFDELIDVKLENSIKFDNITEEESNTIYNNVINHPIYKIILNNDKRKEDL